MYASIYIYMSIYIYIICMHIYVYHEHPKHPHTQQFLKYVGVLFNGHRSAMVWLRAAPGSVRPARPQRRWAFHGEIIVKSD